jgi:hypothetical protein
MTAASWMAERDPPNSKSTARKKDPGHATLAVSATHTRTAKGNLTLRARDGAVEPGLDHYRRLFGPPSQRRGLDRSSLPTPLLYLTQQGLVAAKQFGEWASIRCPVHKSGAEAHPSLRVALADGHFRCHACGAKGGDIIALHRLATGLGFREAVHDLGGRFHD